MEQIRCCSMTVTSMVALMLLVPATMVSGQITTGCTSALINSFTPCFSFLTGSSNGSGTPTAECCKSLANLVSSSADCACLILLGNVPFSLPLNQTLGLALPKICNSMTVPLKCSDNSTPVSGSGSPIAPALPPFPATPPPPSAPAAAPASPADQGGVRPLLLPSSATGPPHLQLSSILVLLGTATMMLLSKI